MNIEDEVRRSFLDYSMSVIISRALPDVRDGLKPVHRRILYAMQQEGLLSTRGYSKSAGVVGEVLKHYHPHGDTAVYDSMVRMAQDFSLRYPLVDGQGNFGSIDGDSAAAYRYTEARLTALAEEMLRDIDRETVDFGPNFDGGMLEPLGAAVALPEPAGERLVGHRGRHGDERAAAQPARAGRGAGAGGAPAGLHARRPARDACPAPTSRPARRSAARDGIRAAYATGRGLLTVRARAEFEDTRRGPAIVVTEIPFMVNKATLQERIAELVREGKIDGVADLRDESNREGMRIVIVLKRDAPGDVVLNQLYKQTPLQTTFGVNLLALVNGRPQTLSLKEALQHFIDFRREVVVRRATYDLAQAQVARAPARGLRDRARAPRRGDRDHPRRRGHRRRARAPDGALRALRAPGQRDPRDAPALADRARAPARARRARGDPRAASRTCARCSRATSASATWWCRSSRRSPRSTATRAAPSSGRRSRGSTTEDLIVEEDMVVTVSHLGYIKRNPLTQYRAQRRGGKGVKGMEARDEDFVERLFVASTHAFILFFTTRGRAHWVKVHELPQLGRAARGKSLANLLMLAEGERVRATLPVRSFEEVGADNVLLCTRKGVIKKTRLDAYSNPRRGGIIAINLDEDDELIAACRTNGSAAGADRQLRGQVDPLPRGAGAPDGPRRRRRARHEPARGRRRGRHGDPRARRDRADRDAARLRQAHAARRLPAPGPRRPGRHHDPHQRAQRQGRERRCRWWTTTRSCSSPTAARCCARASAASRRWAAPRRACG